MNKMILKIFLGLPFLKKEERKETRYIKPNVERTVIETKYICPNFEKGQRSTFLNRCIFSWNKMNKDSKGGLINLMRNQEHKANTPRKKFLCFLILQNYC